MLKALTDSFVLYQTNFRCCYTVRVICNLFFEEVNGITTAMCVNITRAAILRVCVSVRVKVRVVASFWTIM